MKLSLDARRLLDGANFGHLATLQPDGGPKAEPVWIARDGDRVAFTTDARTLKARNVAADPRVAISVVDFDNPYEQLLIRGRVVEAKPDQDLAFLDALALQYTGEAFQRRKWAERVVYFVEVDVARYYASPLQHNPSRATRAGEEDS